MAKINLSFSTLLTINAIPLCLSERTWMYYYKGTYGLMIGFKAALASTSREFSGLQIGQTGGTAQNLQSELEVIGLLPIHCISARVGH